jgi:hypothetical protein
MKGLSMKQNLPARLAAAAAWLTLLAGCQSQGETGGPGPSPDSRVALIEASGLTVRAAGKVAIVGGDETRARLWGVSLEDFSKRWELPFPPGTPPLDDIEALAPWGRNDLFVCCSQSRTKPHGRVKPERNRLALATLTPDARQVTSVRVYDGLREHLLGYLGARAADLVENTEAIAEGTPATGGLNVEGIAAWKEQLLLGLRSPVAKGGAIVIPVNNPAKLFEAALSRNPPEFGQIMILPTAPGEGIRDMCTTEGAVLMILGSSGEVYKTKPRIVRWDPVKNELKQLRVPGFKHIAKPEGIAVDPQGRLLIVQDQLPPLPQVFFRLEVRQEGGEE